MSRMVRAVLFDLDDTLFDHHACARAALEAVHSAHACFNGLPFDEFERQHARFLEELHLAVLDGRLGIDAAREERFRRLFHAAGVAADEALLQATAAAYRERYLTARRAIDGAATLLPHVRRRARVGIVSNHLLDEQQQKLRHCGLDGHIDALVVSEEVGVSKPHPKIFEVALDRVGVRADEAVMIGDSWSADIVGALTVGIRPIWFNRHRQARPDNHAPVTELYALEPVEPVLAAVFGDAA
jgi:YjjG family noncanonical pyrimidine nucleotidase